MTGGKRFLTSEGSLGHKKESPRGGAELDYEFVEDQQQKCRSAPPTILGEGALESSSVGEKRFRV